MPQVSTTITAEKFCNRKSLVAFSHSLRMWNIQRSTSRRYPSAALPAHAWWMSNKKQTLCAKWTSKWNKSNNLNKLWCSPTHKQTHTRSVGVAIFPIRRFGVTTEQLPRVKSAQHSQHLIVAAHYVLNQMVYISLSPYFVSACFIQLHRSAVLFFACPYHLRNISRDRIASYCKMVNQPKRNVAVL